MTSARTTTFTVKTFVLVGLALLAGMFVGIAAGALQRLGIALFGVQSLLVGAALGVMLAGVMSLLRHARGWWLALLTGWFVVVVTQHYWIYQAEITSRVAAIERQPGAAFFKPGWTEESFAAFLWQSATPAAATLWAVDACLILFAAGVIVGLSGTQTPRPADNDSPPIE